jgi:hypothetical protein
LVSPVTVIGLAVPTPVKPPGFEVAVYPVMAEPPSLAGAVNAIEACAFPAVAVLIVGAPGTVEATAIVVKVSSTPYAVPSLLVA